MSRFTFTHTHTHTPIYPVVVGRYCANTTASHGHAGAGAAAAAVVAVAEAAAGAGIGVAAGPAGGAEGEWMNASTPRACLLYTSPSPRD